MTTKLNWSQITDADITEAILNIKGIKYEREGEYIFASVHNADDVIVPVQTPVNFCKDWNLASKIIEEERICMSYVEGGKRVTWIEGRDETVYIHENALRAAMITYVASQEPA